MYILPCIAYVFIVCSSVFMKGRIFICVQGGSEQPFMLLQGSSVLRGEQIAILSATIAFPLPLLRDIFCLDRFHVAREQSFIPKMSFVGFFEGTEVLIRPTFSLSAQLYCGSLLYRQCWTYRSPHIARAEHI